MSDTSSRVAKATEENFVELFQKQENDRYIREGAILDALVVELDGNRVNLDAGLKSPSRIPLEEFRDDNGEISIKPNDFVKVKVELLDDGRGKTHLSHLQYRREKAWKQLLEAHEKGDTVEGVVRERIKGGYSVHINGLRAFLPGSLVDLFPTKRDDTSLIGRTETFCIERLKPDSMSAILNRRVVRERELFSGDLTDMDLKPGNVFTGTVVATVDYPDYTAFINIGEGIHGRLHRDDLYWHRVGKISEELEEGQELKVVVLEVDIEEKLIKLGAKQLTEDPWEQVEKSYPAGTSIYGKVTLVKEYGAFVEIEKGIEGLVHNSEMDWLQRNVQASQYVNIGDEVEVMMLNCDKETRRISLSLKHCKPNPWEEFNVTYRNGSKLRGKIASISEDLGLFVDLPGGLTGLVHKSNLSYLDSWKEEFDKYATGQEIDVFLIGVDLKAQRISLGIKQLSTDPHQAYEQKYRDRLPISATVVKIQERSARLRFDDGIEALLPIGEVSEEHIEKIEDKLNVNDKVEVLIIKIEKVEKRNLEKHKIVVSLKARKSASAEVDVSRHSRDDQGATATAKKKTSFGAMVKETLGMDEAASQAAAEQAKSDASATEDSESADVDSESATEDSESADVDSESATEDSESADVDSESATDESATDAADAEKQEKS